MKLNEPILKNEPLWKKGLYFISIGIILAVIIPLIRPNSNDPNFNEGFNVSAVIFVALSWLVGIVLIVAHFVKRKQQ